jgi:hypothetical protein
VRTTPRNSRRRTPRTVPDTTEMARWHPELTRPEAARGVTALWRGRRALWRPRRPSTPGARSRHTMGDTDVMVNSGVARVATEPRPRERRLNASFASRMDASHSSNPNKTKDVELRDTP